MKKGWTRTRRCAAFLFAACVLSSGAVSCKRSKAAKPLIGVAIEGATAPFGAACLAALEKGAEGRAQLAVAQGGGSQKEFLARIDDLVARGAKALVVAPASASEVGPVIARAKEKQVPLVLLGEEPKIEALRSWDKVLFVGHSASRAGAAMAEVLAACWKAVPAIDRDRDGALRLAFVGLSASFAADERDQACVEALGKAGIKATPLAVDGGAAIAALASRAGSRVEAVAADDAASAAAAADALEAGGAGKGRPRVPVVAFAPGRAAPSPAELAGLRLAGAVSGDPAAIGDAALDAAYALAFGRDPADSGFELVEGKSLILPYAEVRSPDFDPKPSKK